MIGVENGNNAGMNHNVRGDSQIPRPLVEGGDNGIFALSKSKEYTRIALLFFKEVLD